MLYFSREEMNMDVLVPCKRAIDYNVNVTVKADESGVEENVKMSINPFDEIALEEAIRLKEKGHIDQIKVISIGPNGCQDVLRHGLAMGADEGIWIQSDSVLEPLNIATILQWAVHHYKIQNHNYRFLVLF